MSPQYSRPVVSRGIPSMNAAQIERDSVVIIPTYNEAENLDVLVPILMSYAWLDAVIVDDESPDGTGAVAERLAQRFSGRVLVIHRPKRLGLGTALVRGFAYALAAGYDRILQMDADLSHDPAVLPEMRRALDRVDVVIASRYVPGAEVVNRTASRRALSRGASAYTRSLLRLPIRDPMGGYKGFRRAALAALDFTAIRSRGYAIQAEISFLCIRRGLRLIEVPAVFRDRIHGRSKLTWPIVFEAVTLPLTLHLGRRPAEVKPETEPGSDVRPASS